MLENAEQYRRKPTKVAMIIYDVPVKLRTRFKTVCSSEGKNMSEVLRDFMRRYTARIERKMKEFTEDAEGTE